MTSSKILTETICTLGKYGLTGHSLSSIYFQPAAFQNETLPTFLPYQPVIVSVPGTICLQGVFYGAESRLNFDGLKGKWNPFYAWHCLDPEFTALTLSTHTTLMNSAGGLRC